MKRLALLALLTASFSAHAATPLSLAVGDGIALDAIYYAADEPGPALLFLNMCDPSRDQHAWQIVATDLAKKGFHVLTFDYRGFGDSGGERPTHLRSVNEAMPWWRENWMSDVQAAFNTLAEQDGVDSRVGIAGASCGVFLGLEFALKHPEVESIVFLGGPTDESQRDQLAERDELPILLITGDERGPNETRGTREWSDEVFAVTGNSNSRILKYKTVTHGTNVFEHHPETQQMIVDWFVKTMPLSKQRPVKITAAGSSPAPFPRRPAAEK